MSAPPVSRLRPLGVVGFVELHDSEFKGKPRLIGLGHIVSVGPSYFGEGTHVSTVGGGVFVATEAYEVVLASIADASAPASADLLRALKIRALKRAAPAVDELHGQGIGCPDCRPDDPAGAMTCWLIDEIKGAIDRAEGRQ